MGDRQMEWVGMESLEAESCHDANFGFTGGNGGAFR